MKKGEIKLNFKREYYLGIGTGLLATSVAQALGNQWWILFIVGAIFVFYSVIILKRNNKK